MRKATVKDMFDFARYIDKLNIKDTFYSVQKNKEDVEKIGFDLVFSLLCVATSEEAERGLYEAVCKPFEMPSDEVGNLAPTQFIEMFMNCYDITTLLNFINRASN